MRKLICIAAIGLCAAPAMAAGTTSNLPLLSTLTSGKAATGSSNPLPPLQLETSLTVPGFGSATEPKIDPIRVPGLLSISPAYKNEGQDNGSAKLSNTVTLNPSSDKTPTGLAADLANPQKGQVAASLGYHGAGQGKSSHPDPTTQSLPLGGKLTSETDNGGDGKTLDSVLTYTSPALGQ